MFEVYIAHPAETFLEIKDVYDAETIGEAMLIAGENLLEGDKIVKVVEDTTPIEDYLEHSCQETIWFVEAFNIWGELECIVIHAVSYEDALKQAEELTYHGRVISVTPEGSDHVWELESDDDDFESDEG